MHNAKVVLRRQLIKTVSPYIKFMPTIMEHSQLAIPNIIAVTCKWVLVQTITNSLLLQTGACPDHGPLAWHVLIDLPTRMYPL